MALVQSSRRVQTIGGKNVPLLAIGTWSWGDSWVWGHRDGDLEDIKEAWTECTQAGLVFFDTAEVYGEGKGEEIIGNLIQNTEEDIKKRLLIATKYFPIPRPANLFLFNPGVVAACKKSLKRLGIDQIDLYQVHANSGLHSIEAIAKGLADCVHQGLARSIGVCNYNLQEVETMQRELKKYNVELTSNQVEFSLVRQLPMKNGLKEGMDRMGIVLLAFSPLGMGRLTGKYSSKNPTPSSRRFANQYTWAQLDPLIDAFKHLADKYSVTPSAIALNWVICQGAIPLGGARNGIQARENAKALTVRLKPEEVGKLTKLGFDGVTTGRWQHG